MEINIRNSYNLIFHPFQGATSRSHKAKRLLASVGCCIATLGLGPLIIGCIQKYRISKSPPAGSTTAKTDQLFERVQGNKGTQPITAYDEFMEKHPQVIGPTHWVEWGFEMGKRTLMQACASLPPNIEDILQGTCPIHPDKKVEDTHLLIYIPEGLTFQKLQELAMNRIPGSNKHALFVIDKDEVANLNKAPKTKGHWALVAREVLTAEMVKPQKHSNLLYADQVVQEYNLKKQTQYHVPSVFECLIAMSALRFMNEKGKKIPLLFTDGFVRVDKPNYSLKEPDRKYVKDCIQMPGFGQIAQLSGQDPRGRPGIALMRAFP